MRVRDFAASKGFEIKGKLRRMPEQKPMDTEAKKKKSACAYYMDEAGNEFWMERDGSGGCIVTKDGGVK